MKHLLFLSSLVALSPVATFAQPKMMAPQVVVEPATKATLDKAIKKYHAAQGVQFKLLTKDMDGESRYSVSFQKPNLLRVEVSEGGETSQIISDGKASYSIKETTYKREDLPLGVPKLWQSVLVNGTGYLMSDMLEGRSPLVQLRTTLERSPEPSRMTVKVPPPAVVDGVSLHGVKINYSLVKPKKNASAPMAELYLWFDKDDLLRRISTRSVENQQSFTMTEQISEQRLNPTFAPDTFKFDATGLTLAQVTQEELGYNPLLKVGAAPIAFEAKDMKGQTISPAKYKGKVLLLDFWATWCGPCVAALPELKAVYDKYHAKGFEVVGISLDQDQKALTSFVKTRKMAWPQVYDGKGWDSRIGKMYGVQAIPFTLLIGKNGKIAAVEPDELEDAVKTALAAK